MSEMGPMWLTVQLAGVTTAVLLVLGTPLAWWLARTRATIKPVVETVTPTSPWRKLETARCENLPFSLRVTS